MALRKVTCLLGILGTVVAGMCDPAELQLDFEQPASIEWVTGERLEIEWKEVRDSRCAIGATCVWEGEVTISVDVVADGVSFSGIEMTLHGDEIERAVARVQGYRLQLVEVQPYPILDEEIDRGNDEARIIVSPPSDGGDGTGLLPLNGQWQLEASGKLGQEVPVLPGTDVNLRLDLAQGGSGSVAGRVAGSAGCNGFSGAVQAAPIGAIRFGDLASTDMACETDVMDQEYRFLTELSHTIGFDLDRDNRLRLLFKHTDGVVGAMVFSHHASTAITAGSWGQLKARRTD